MECGYAPTIASPPKICLSVSSGRSVCVFQVGLSLSGHSPSYRPQFTANTLRPAHVSTPTQTNAEGKTSPSLTLPLPP